MTSSILHRCRMTCSILHRRQMTRQCRETSMKRCCRRRRSSFTAGSRAVTLHKTAWSKTVFAAESNPSTSFTVLLEHLLALRRMQQQLSPLQQRRSSAQDQPPQLQRWHNTLLSCMSSLVQFRGFCQRQRNRTEVSNIRLHRRCGCTTHVAHVTLEA